MLLPVPRTSKTKEDSPNKQAQVYIRLQKWARNVPKKETDAIYGWNVSKDTEFEIVREYLPRKWIESKHAEKTNVKNCSTVEKCETSTLSPTVVNLMLKLLAKFRRL